MSINKFQPYTVDHVYELQNMFEIVGEYSKLDVMLWKYDQQKVRFKLGCGHSCPIAETLTHHAFQIESSTNFPSHSDV